MLGVNFYQAHQAIARQNQGKKWVTVKRHTGFWIFVTYLICDQRLVNDVFQVHSIINLRLDLS